MRALQTSWFVFVGALVVAVQACSFETELNPQPLPPEEPSDHGEATNGPDRGADPGANPGGGFDSSDAGAERDADGGDDDASDGSAGDGG